jgi:hypothetical protein
LRLCVLLCGFAWKMSFTRRREGRRKDAKKSDYDTTDRYEFLDQTSNIWYLPLRLATGINPLKTHQVKSLVSLIPNFGAQLLLQRQIFTPDCG